MLIEVLVGAVIGLVLLVAIVSFVIKRAPLLFVADRLPEKLHSGADEVDELVTGSDGLDEAGLDAGEKNDYD